MGRGRCCVQVVQQFSDWLPRLAAAHEEPAGRSERELAGSAIGIVPMLAASYPIRQIVESPEAFSCVYPRTQV